MGDVGPYSDGYMEQEEEWEREGLLDPAWEKQQRKVSFLGSPTSRTKTVFPLPRHGAPAFPASAIAEIVLCA
ncbi:hypothetical protein HPB48_020033 [Haemaphysalis longicornis]|uniref:Alpha-actinin n=1 Tax=Haemaphysalis longicornis TaxID=44386 RepID=A0A9J6GJV8_HAELO|nr:hypothetical protein HPB48_020033 [Haemaphysalis longicornis]